MFRLSNKMATSRAVCWSWQIS